MYRSLLRPVAAVAALAGLAAYATITLRGPRGISALQEKQAEIRRIQEENANLRRDIDEKKARVERIRHDASTQEQAVEQYLGKVHPGDTQFRIPGQHTGSTQQKPPAIDETTPAH